MIYFVIVFPISAWWCSRVDMVTLLCVLFMFVFVSIFYEMVFSGLYNVYKVLSGYLNRE